MAGVGERRRTRVGEARGDVGAMVGMVNYTRHMASLVFKGTHFKGYRARVSDDTCANFLCFWRGAKATSHLFWLNFGEGARELVLWAQCCRKYLPMISLRGPVSLTPPWKHVPEAYLTDISLPLHHYMYGKVAR